jgi:hypothetical protein
MLYYVTYDIWYVSRLTFWLQCEICMSIIAANGPALKVFYNEYLSRSSSDSSTSNPNRRSRVWPKSWPRLKIEWTRYSLNSGDLRTVFLPIREKAPKLSTVQVSQFQITEMMSQRTVGESTLRGDDEFEDDWSDVLDKRQRAYYGV